MSPLRVIFRLAGAEQPLCMGWPVVAQKKSFGIGTPISEHGLLQHGRGGLGADAVEW